MSGDESQDNEEFALVMGRRLKRRMRNAALNSSSSVSTIVITDIQPLTLVFTTVRPMHVRPERTSCPHWEEAKSDGAGSSSVY